MLKVMCPCKCSCIYTLLVYDDKMLMNVYTLLEYDDKMLMKSLKQSTVIGNI